MSPNRSSLSALALCLLLQHPASATGIPVVDAAGLVQAIQQVVQLKEQIDNQIKQITELKSQVRAISGTRGLGQIYNDPRLREFLPNEWTDLYDRMQRGDYKGAAGQMARQIRQKEGLEGIGLSEAQNRIYQTLSSNKALSLEAFQKTRDRLDNIQSLMVQANATGDLKASADLSNRLAAENATIQAEQIRISLMQQMQAAELRIAEEGSVRSQKVTRRGEHQ